jgi:alpha-galactosidase
MNHRRDFLRKASAASLMAAGLGACGRGRATLTGTWKVTIGRLPDGRDLDAFYVLEEKDGQLSGTTTHYGFHHRLRDARLDGPRFSFEDPAFQLPARVEGRLDGERLVLTANYGDTAPYSQVLDSSILKVPSAPKNVRYDFVGVRVPAGSQQIAKALPLPPLRDLPYNGLAPTPPMVWGAWYGYTIAVSDPMVREIAEALVSSGLRDAGFDVLNMEVGWTGQRDSKGNLTANPKFPDMKALADFVHSRGLKLGICTSPGALDCTGFLGSHGYEEQDARTWADWGIDYIKHDHCAATALYSEDQHRALYQKMGEALQNCGRPIVYSLCQYGMADVPTWGAKAGGNLWRVRGDIFDTWESISDMGFRLPDHSAHAGPGRWNDYDYLMVGQGLMSDDEYRTQMTQWCMLASPLITSVDPRNLTALEKQILLNKELIAVDQDARGIAGRRVWSSGDQEIWARPVTGGHAVALYNLGEQAATMRLDLDELSLPKVRRARDLWAHEDVKLANGTLAVEVPRHASVALRIESEEA